MPGRENLMNPSVKLCLLVRFLFLTTEMKPRDRAAHFRHKKLASEIFKPFYTPETQRCLLSKSKKSHKMCKHRTSPLMPPSAHHKADTKDIEKTQKEIKNSTGTSLKSLSESLSAAP